MAERHLEWLERLKGLYRRLLERGLRDSRRFVLASLVVLGIAQVGATPVLVPGHVATLTVVFAKAGNFARCAAIQPVRNQSLSEHRARRGGSSNP